MTSKTQLVHALSLRRWCAALLAVGATTAMVIVGLVAGTPAASAAQSTVGLGTATSFAVLAGQTVTNTGPSIISGDLGVSPGTAVTGFPPGLVNNGTIHAADATAKQAQADLTKAFSDAAGRPSTASAGTDLGGKTFAAGVYTTASGLGLTGTVTLDAKNNPDSVFIFQVGSTLITASNSTVMLINGASSCNVFFEVGSSATLGTNTTFVGSILAQTSASVQTGTTVNGRVLARTGQVSLDTNTITRPSCTTTPTTTTNPPAATTKTTPPTTTNGGPGGAGNGGPTTTTTPPTTTSSGPSGSGGAAGPGGAGSGGAAGPGGAGNGGSGGSAGPGGAGSGGAGGAVGSGGAAGSGGAGNGSSGGSAGPGGAGTGTVAGQVIPLGHPETGAGGASHSRNNTLIGLGALALAGAGVAMIPDTRRRRLPSQGPGGRHQAGR